VVSSTRRPDGAHRFNSKLGSEWKNRIYRKEVTRPGNRVFSHLEDEKECAKVEQIKELKQRGCEPKIEILIHGLEDEKAALRVESSVIDLIGVNNLTNIQSGYKSATHGRMSVAQVASAYERTPVQIEEPAILIRISQAFRHSMSPVELYDYTRGQWRLNPENAMKAQLAFSIYSGIVQEVYEPVGWYKAGETFSVREDNANIKRGRDERLEGRFEFVGNIAPEEIRKKYRFKSVENYFEKGNSNPVMYVNCGGSNT
jgi:hypothetical protein